MKRRQVLILIGCLTSVCAVALTCATPEWPAQLVVPLALLFGATAIGWNGVQLSEVARLAAPGTAGEETGATGFVTFAGVVVGPPSFAVLSALTGGYRTGFAAFAALSI